MMIREKEPPGWKGNLFFTDDGTPWCLQIMPPEAGEEHRQEIRTFKYLPGSSPTPNDSDSGGSDSISKLPTNGKLPTTEQQAPVLKHPGGRPRKEIGEEMSTTTLWRRNKEAEQGKLF